VVTHAYIADLGKWIMLDPTWCSYVKDEAGNILDVVELRRFLADGKDLFLNEEFSYNGDNLITNDERVRFYKRYLAKDLFYFTTYETSGFGRENADRDLFICPAAYNPFEVRIYGLEYEIEFVRTHEDLDEASRKAYLESSTKYLEITRELLAEEQGDVTERTYFIYPLKIFWRSLSCETDS
jgi:hypothetical protein